MSDGVVEIISGRERRRRWSTEDKLRIVAETHEPGACVKQVAARHDVYPALLFAWRRQAREGKLAARSAPVFVPVRMAEVPSMPDPAVAKHPAVPLARTTDGRIEIAFKDGSRVYVDGEVSLTALRRVITALRG